MNSVLMTALNDILYMVIGAQFVYQYFMYRNRKERTKLLDGIRGTMDKFPRGALRERAGGLVIWDAVLDIILKDTPKGQVPGQKMIDELLNGPALDSQSVFVGPRVMPDLRNRDQLS